MTQEWLAEELRLWNLLNHCDRDVSVMARKVKRLPAGKNKTTLQQQVTKVRARQFAAGWSAFDSLMTH